MTHPSSALMFFFFLIVTNALPTSPPPKTLSQYSISQPDFVTGAGRHWEETAAVPEPSTLTWEGLGYSVIDYKGDTKQVLRGVAGSARPGTITGIMGPSGAGKVRRRTVSQTQTIVLNFR